MCTCRQQFVFFYPSLLASRTYLLRMSSRSASAIAGKHWLMLHDERLWLQAGAMHDGDWTRWTDSETGEIWHSNPSATNWHWEQDSFQFMCPTSYRSWWQLASGGWHWGPMKFSKEDKGRLPVRKAPPKEAPLG